MICPKCGATIEGGYRYVTCPKCGEMCDALKMNNNDGIKRSSFENSNNSINEDGAYHFVFKKPAQKNTNDPNTTNNRNQNNINTTINMNNTQNSQSNQTFQPQNTPTGSNQPQMNVSEKRENILAGIVGATLGSLIGVVAIVLIDQLGYVAAISGIIMAICAVRGYELLEGNSHP